MDPGSSSVDVLDTTAILSALRLCEGVSRGGVFHQLAGGGLRGEQLESVCAAYHMTRHGIHGSNTIKKHGYMGEGSNEQQHAMGRIQPTPHGIFSHHHRHRGSPFLFPSSMKHAGLLDLDAMKGEAPVASGLSIWGVKAHRSGTHGVYLSTTPDQEKNNVFGTNKTREKERNTRPLPRTKLRKIIQQLQLRSAARHLSN